MVLECQGGLHRDGQGDRRPLAGELSLSPGLVRGFHRLGRAAPSPPQDRVHCLVQGSGLDVLRLRCVLEALQETGGLVEVAALAVEEDRREQLMYTVDSDATSADCWT